MTTVEGLLGVWGIQGTLCCSRQRYRSAMSAEEKQDEKESLGQGTSAKLHHFEYLFQSLSHQTKPVWLDKHPSQEGYTLHIAKRNVWSQIKFKNPLNPEEQHQNVNAFNQSGLVLPLQPGHIVTAHTYRPHCPIAATWFLLLSHTKSLDTESVRICLEKG